MTRQQAPLISGVVAAIASFIVWLIMDNSLASSIVFAVIVACALSLVLLVGDYPSERNLLIAILAGVAFGIGSWFWLERH